MQLTVAEEVTTGKIKQRKRVTQGYTISAKLFRLALEDVFKSLNWEQSGIKIVGQYLKHLSFADVIILISNNIDKLHRSIKELKRVSEE